MTIQTPRVEVEEPRLLQDSYKQKEAEESFKEKLEQEKARIGLMFSPFAQLSSILAMPLPSAFSADDLAFDDTSFDEDYTAIRQYQERTAGKTADKTTRETTIIREERIGSLPLPVFSKKNLADLMAGSNWLVPNIQAQPFVFQAFTQGKLQPSFDLQSLIDKLIEQVNVVKSKGRVELMMALKPDDLGEIMLTLTARAGGVAVQIQSSPETKKLIDHSKEELERALEKAHINVESLSIVSVTEVKDDV